MSYQVLARKWRPRTFKELVGQEHVLKALINALDNDRLHHAFLFTGTRGVGKTTIARILAKSLNCEKGVSSTPCGECSACTEVNEGRFIDLIEVDAASRTGVDDTRELLENVQYAPSRGRYKVYLIDEVHMFSKSSFNALLKTLEEPPRCLQFNLKRIPLELIRDHLGRVLSEENINFEDTALALISRAADGSMRDALSLLDQAIANGGGQVNADEVRTMLGSIDQDHVIDLLKLLADADAPGLLTRIDKLAQQSPDFAGVLAELISSLHRIALAQTAPNAVDDGLGDRKNIVELAQSMSPEDVQLYYQIALIGRRDLPLAPDARGGFEMVLLRMLAFRPVDSTHAVPVTNAVPVKTAPVVNPVTSPVAKKTANSTPTPTPSNTVETTPQKTVPAANKDASEWENIVTALNLTGMTQQLAIHCTIGKRDEESFQLNMAPTHKHLLSQSRQEALAAALGQHLDLTINLIISVEDDPGSTPANLQQTRDDIRLDQARTTIEDDAAVQAFKDTFDAQVNPDTVQPVD
jgi:DNA polymerase-3 subunit gamma/tau